LAQPMPRAIESFSTRWMAANRAMILLDVNVLVRAHRPDFPGSTGTREWLETALGGDEPVAIWDHILVSSYRVLTHPKYVREADAPERAMAYLQQVREASIIVNSGDRHWVVVKKLIEGARATGNLVTDAAIAAVAIENGCRLATFDQDFSRFPALQWFEPQI
jgi:toxin-antitoxin system PIN domain toxin